MNKLPTPSTSLYMLTSHKLADYSRCLRLYFWRWIHNLETSYVNDNFWYGALLGAGIEALLTKQNIRAAMTSEHERFISRYHVSDQRKEDMEIKYNLILSIIDGFRYHPKYKHIHATANQSRFSVPLQRSGLMLCGTRDLSGLYRKTNTLFEIKTASQINDGYIDTLQFDYQPGCYTYAYKLSGEPCPKQCLYLIFPKPQKKLKTSRGQTVTQYIQEIHDDCHDPKRRDYYYRFIQFPITEGILHSWACDIENLACLMQDRYDQLIDENCLLDPYQWIREGFSSKACTQYGCEYLPLCKMTPAWKANARGYQMRELRYAKIERQELQK